MKTILAIDIGNTNITLGIFKGKRLVRRSRIPTSRFSRYKTDLKAFVAKWNPDGVIISSVVPEALKKLKKVLSGISKSKIRVLGEGATVPIKNLYRIKAQVGQDRLVNAFAAKVLYGTPAVVIDFGTAITFDIVSGRGGYLGGLILPGIEMSLTGLYEKTALLPKVRLAATPDIIGRDTVNSIRGGILFGFGAMCDSLILRYRKLLGKDLKVIATGGNSKLIKRYAKSIQRVDEDLTLKGLMLIGLVSI
jgi:type III pantothenate kinase